MNADAHGPEQVRAAIGLSRDQVRRIDKRAIEEFGIPGIVLMENASRAVVDVAVEMLDAVNGKFVSIFCGPGNNGGDGLAVARHLHNRGFHVDVVRLFDESRLHGDAAVQWNIVRAMGFDVSTGIDGATLALDRGPDLIIDAMLGTGSTGAPRGDIAAAIEAIGSMDNRPPVLSVDLPSGLDCDLGTTAGVCIRAAKTVTFVASKIGFGNASAKQWLGEVIVGDIGCPRELVEHFNESSRGL